MIDAWIEGAQPDATSVMNKNCLVADKHVVGVDALDGEVVDDRVLGLCVRARYLDQVAVCGLEPLPAPQLDRVDPPTARGFEPAVVVDPERVTVCRGQRPLVAVFAAYRDVDQCLLA